MKSKLYAFLHFLLAVPVRLIFCISCKTRKKEPPLEDGGLLICANHISVLDPVLICAVLKKHQPRLMAKKELFKVPISRTVRISEAPGYGEPICYHDPYGKGST